MKLAKKSKITKWNKRGESTVEAAIVIPVVILLILSMIIMLIYFYEGLHVQAKMHERLSQKAMNSKVIFHVENESKEVSTIMKGIGRGILRKEISGKCYMLNPSDAIRLKKGFEKKTGK